MICYCLFGERDEKILVGFIILILKLFVYKENIFRFVNFMEVFYGFLFLKINKNKDGFF